MSNNPFDDRQLRSTALTASMSESALRAQQTLVTFFFSASQAQFGFGLGLAGDVTEALKAKPAAIRTLMIRGRDGSEWATGEFRHIGDDLRDSLYGAVAPLRPKASEAASKAAEKTAEERQQQP